MHLGQALIIGARRTNGLLACAFLAAACNNVASLTDMGSPPRDEAKVKIATAAKATSDAIDYLAPINQERSNQAKLLSFEIAAVRSFALARRNSELTELLPDERTQHLTARLKTKINNRIGVLVGDREPTFKEINQLRGLSGDDIADELCGGSYAPPDQSFDRTARIAQLVSTLAIKIDECEATVLRAQRSLSQIAGFDAPSCPANGEIKKLDDAALNRIADLTAEIALHQERVNAFFEEEEAIEPPDDDIIEALRANLDALNGLTKDRTLLANVVVITTTAAETFQSVQA